MMKPISVWKQELAGGIHTARWRCPCCTGPAEAEAEKAAQILREEMEGCVHYAVPLSTDVHTGKNWLEAH